MPDGQSSTAATSISVMVDEQSKGTYPLHRNKSVEVSNSSGKAIIEIRDGRVRIASSSCRSKQCVLSSWHQYAGDHIVCLPNRIVVSLQSAEQRFDAINF
jgi:hypothetical protein